MLCGERERERARERERERERETERDRERQRETEIPKQRCKGDSFAQKTMLVDVESLTDTKKCANVADCMSTDRLHAGSRLSVLYLMSDSRQAGKKKKVCTVLVTTTSNCR